MEDNDLRQDVENYLEANRDTVDRVVSAFQAAGGDASALDELVLDVAGEYGAAEANRTDDEDEQEAAISAAESEGSALNNEGLHLQVAAVLMGSGMEEGERLVMSEAGSAPAAP